VTTTYATTETGTSDNYSYRLGRAAAVAERRRRRQRRTADKPGNGADRPGRIATAVPVWHDAGVHRRPVQLARAGRPPHETRAGRPVHRRRAGRLGRGAHMHGHVFLDEQRARRRRRREYNNDDLHISIPQRKY